MGLKTFGVYQIQKFLYIWSHYTLNLKSFRYPYCIVPFEIWCWAIKCCRSRYNKAIKPQETVNERQWSVLDNKDVISRYFPWRMYTKVGDSDNVDCVYGRVEVTWQVLKTHHLSFFINTDEMNRSTSRLYYFKRKYRYIYIYYHLSYGNLCTSFFIMIF